MMLVHKCMSDILEPLLKTVIIGVSVINAQVKGCHFPPHLVFYCSENLEGNEISGNGHTAMTKRPFVGCLGTGDDFKTMNPNGLRNVLQTRLAHFFLMELLKKRLNS